MNTTTLSTLTLAVSLFALAGCGSDSNSGGTPTPPATGTSGGATAGGGGNIPANSGGGDSGSSAVIFDRMGRPGISTALVAAADRKDAYNLSGNPDDWRDLFRADLLNRIEIIDGLDDDRTNALLGDAGALADLLVDDRLQIDTSRAECDAYLVLEIGLEEPTCGGRTLERDVIDDTLRHLVSQMDPISDLANVDGSTTTTWPFLGEPNLGGTAQ